MATNCLEYGGPVPCSGVADRPGPLEMLIFNPSIGNLRRFVYDAAVEKLHVLVAWGTLELGGPGPGPTEPIVQGPLGTRCIQKCKIQGGGVLFVCCLCVQTSTNATCSTTCV